MVIGIQYEVYEVPCSLRYGESVPRTGVILVAFGNPCISTALDSQVCPDRGVPHRGWVAVSESHQPTLRPPKRVKCSSPSRPSLVVSAMLK